MQTADYTALHDSAAWLDLGGRGKIIARGEDRARLLHAMTSNHVEGLRPGEGCYAFFLNAQGRILGDVNIFCSEDHFLLDTEPETAAKLYAHLDKYIIADDVTLEDATSEITTISVEGPNAAVVLGALGAPVPETPHSHATWNSVTVAHVDTTGSGGFFLFAPSTEKESLTRRLEAAGAVFAGAGAARAVRLENGKPRYTDDFNEDCLPQETQLLHALHFNKGCYLGQEIVERVRSRGHVNRLLVRLAIEDDQPPAAQTKVTVEGKDAGQVTSSAWSPLAGKVLAFAYVRADWAAPGSVVEAGGTPARVLPLRPPAA